MLVRIHGTTLGPPPVCVKVRDATWRSEFVPWSEGLLLAWAQDLGEDLSRVVLNRLPHPPRLACAAYKAPPLLHRGCFHLVDDDLHGLSLKTLEKACMYLL